MKSYPVVRSLSHLAAGARWAACRLAACRVFAGSLFAGSLFAGSLLGCSASNGALFDEELIGAGTGEPSEPEQPATASPDMSPPSDAPPPDAPEGEAPSNTESPSDGDLPLSGGFPSSPVNGTPSEQTPDEPEAPAEPERPVIVSVSPADGALGVDSAQSIVIEFSTPMDRAATEAAYQSESIPSSSVSFVWNDAGTKLSIVPSAPLAYPVGADPADVPRRRVSFFISASATDLEGRGLAAPFESSFSLLRQIELNSFALRDRNLSGSFRSNDTYGAGQCARAQINMCVGDARVNGSSEQYKGFISFEVAELPEEAQAIQAELTLEITGMSGNPFAGLGGLVLEHASFAEIGAEAFAADALEEIGLIADAGGTGTIVRADVAAAFMADRRERALTQYRLRFEDDTDGDNTSDAIVSAWDTQAIVVSYLIP